MGTMKDATKRGMILFPNPLKRSSIRKKRNVLVIKECYCHNGHNLISDQAIFDSHHGIVLKMKKGKKEGLVALSPLYGYKSRVSFGLKVYTDEIWEPHCPECNEPLPKFATCSCESDKFVMFLDKKADFENCMILCKRVDCDKSEMKFNNKTVHFRNVRGLIQQDDHYDD